MAKKARKDEDSDDDVVFVVDDLDNDDGEDKPVKKEKPKFNWFARQNAAPSALGSKEIPVGKPDCLLGLTFVITGQLSSITREDTADLVKKYGGRVTSAVSGKTTYLIVGDEPGESKIAKAKSLKVTTLDEDSFFELVKTRGPSGSAPAATQAPPKKGKATSSKATEKPAARNPNFYWDVLNARPSAPGSKDVPTGKPGCLNGMTFVMTGQLSSIDRDDTTELIQSLGGRVTNAVSGKTTYLLVGEDPGATKITKADSLGTPKMDEDEFFAFVRSFEDSKPVPTQGASIKASTSVKATQPDVVKESSSDKPNKSSAKNPNYYRNVLNARPSAPGSKEVPTGKPGCLSGMTFVMTGQLSSIDRDETTELIQSLGGRVTNAVSGKTTYLLVGEDAGATKISKAKSLGTPQLDEDGFFDFIRSFEDSSTTIKKEDSEPTLQASQPSIRGTQPQSQVSVKKGPVAENIRRPTAEVKESSQLWVDKYKPQFTKELCGNNTNIKKLVEWLSNWNPHDQEEKAVLISGKPGIGKTTSAQLACKEAGYTAIEFNASDSRSKKTVEDILGQFIDNRSISEFFKPTTQVKTKSKTTKTAVILDEIDGMSGSDRGGVAEVIKYIKKTKVPIICICNDAKSVKVRSLANHCLKLAFSKPMVTSIRNRIDMIAKKEGLTLGINVIEKLFDMTGGDIRQTINLLSTWRLSKSYMSYDEGKEYSKAVQKNTVLDVFKVTSKYLSASEYQSHTFAERLEFYFHDFQLVPLMVQENYIRCKPSGISKIADPQLAELEHLDRLSKAADAMCEADLVDRSIHLSQNWGLMPVHAAFSCGMPSSYMHGIPAMFLFSSWLGKNSSANKYARLLKEAHLHMKSRISGDKNELRQSYIPTLSKKLIGPLINKGQDGIEEIIQIMDHYHLDKDDWDTVIELKTGADKVKDLLSSIPTSTKSAFTRTYNKSNHPTIVHINPTSKRAKEKAISAAEAALEIDDVLAAEDDTVEINDESEEDEDTPSESNTKKRKASSAATGRGGKKTRGKK